jgi:DNA-binding response OmpR family regulator
MHILLVEDDAVLADGISRILQAHGMVVDVVNNGNDVEAVTHLSASPLVDAQQ